jgi:hypothetical protein
MSERQLRIIQCSSLSLKNPCPFILFPWEGEMETLRCISSPLGKNRAGSRKGGMGCAVVELP